MHRTGQKVVVIGAGAAGLSVAAGLAERGHDVTVLERRSERERNRHAARATQSRLQESHGTFPQPRCVAASDICEAETFRRRLPRAVREATAWYFVPADQQSDLRSPGRSSNGSIRECPGDRCPLSRSFREANDLCVYRFVDRLIDSAHLISALDEQLRLVGGRTIFSADILGCRCRDNLMASVFARTPYGFQKFTSDVVVNAAGVRGPQMLERLGGRTQLDRMFRAATSLELRCPWPFSCEPAILQFLGPPGLPILRNLRVAPIADRWASVTMDHWLPVADPDEIEHDVRAECHALRRLVAEGFDRLELPEPLTAAWRLKALEPTRGQCVQQRPCSRVRRGSEFGGPNNEVICAPVKLRSVLALRDEVCGAVEQLLSSSHRALTAA